MTIYSSCKFMSLSIDEYDGLRVTTYSLFATIFVIMVNLFSADAMIINDNLFYI